MFKGRTGLECGEVSGVPPLFPTERAWEGGPQIALWGTGKGRSCHWAHIHTHLEDRDCFTGPVQMFHGLHHILGVTVCGVSFFFFLPLLFWKSYTKVMEALVCRMYCFSGK